MATYYRENTGIKTAQDHNLDYFQIDTIGAENRLTQARATVLLYQFEADAKANKVPNAERTVVWDLSAQTDLTQGVQSVLQWDSVQTTANDFISLIGAVEV